ncbi:MAG: hypothetical protein U0270_05880 [Labilithrix sp.]
MRGLAFLALVVMAIVAGCASTADVEEIDESGDAISSFTGASTDVAGVPTTFQRNRVMDDAFYTDSSWATAAEIQSFLENTVWNRPSWLATETIVLFDHPGSAAIPVSQAIVRTAQAHHINPLLLLARMQVEKSLVSAERRPAEAARSFGLGCHKATVAHPNGLDPSVAALNIQLECGATTLENQMTKANAGDNNFDVGHEATTQDGVQIRPVNAATSALYAYTPIEGTRARNGNWLVWNITRRFAAAIQSAREPAR